MSGQSLSRRIHMNGVTYATPEDAAQRMCGLATGRAMSDEQSAAISDADELCVAMGGRLCSRQAIAAILVAKEETP